MSNDVPDSSNVVDVVIDVASVDNVNEAPSSAADDGSPTLRLQPPASSEHRVLAFEEDAALFQAENRQYLLDLMSSDLKPLSNAELFRVLKTAILCQLEADFDFYTRRADRPERAEQVREALAMYKKVFQVSSWQTFGVLYERLVLRGGRPDYYIRHIARRQRDDGLTLLPQQQQQQSHAASSGGRRNLLDDCFLEYSRRMEYGAPTMAQLRTMQGLSFSFYDCQLCLEPCRVAVSRDCCSAKICLGCMESWVATKVLARSIEVGCPSCDGFLNSGEIQLFMGDQAHRYLELVADANRNSRLKTCPQCNALTRRPRGSDRAQRLEKISGGQTVTCERCQFEWCFRCHGPTHQGISCAKNLSGESLMLAWASQTYRDGYDTLRTARRCPNCGVWIEKTQGCHHMICSQCSSQFCFRCGCKWNVGNFLFGTHADQFSIFGCKKSLLPDRPVARKLARGSLFGLELLGLVVGLPAGFCLVVGLSPLIGIGTVGYFAYKHRRDLPTLY